jgi:hypothetical protein
MFDFFENGGPGGLLKTLLKQLLAEKWDKKGLYDFPIFSGSIVPPITANCGNVCGSSGS